MSTMLTPSEITTVSGEITILISESSPMGCQLLREALERSCERFKIVASAHSVEQIVEGARRRPDIVLISGALQDER